MVRRLRLAALAVGALVLGLVGFTTWALESGGVAVIETRDAQGGVRTTHVWHAEIDGNTWLEAGAPGNGWVQDIGLDPRVVLTTGSLGREFVARLSPDRAMHARLREELRAKYGLRDRWVGFFVDSSQSFAVKLDPMPRMDQEVWP